MTFPEYRSSLGGTSHLYANASNGFNDLLEYLVRRSGIEKPNVILPAFIPAKLYRAALAGGCEVKFYEVYEPCTFDLAEVEGLIDSNTLAVFHVHYFGFANQIHEMRDLTKKKDVLLIEDCALTMSATSRGKALGTIGDFAIFSMRKMFLFSEGGLVRFSEPFSDFQPHYEWRVKNCFSVSKYVLQRAKYAYVRLTAGADPLHLVKPDPTGYMDWSTPKQTLHVKMMSSFSVFRLNFADVTKAVDKRRENYNYVSKHFPVSDNLQPIHPKLPEGCTPYSFPLLVNNGQRDKLRTDLLANGTKSGVGWPESPYTEKQTRTKVLATKLLEVPIHQALTQKQIDRSLRVLEKMAR